METTFELLLELEHAGWRSLCDGTAGEFYWSIMTPDARMVLANGVVMTRAEVVDALRDAPSWNSYEIDDPITVAVGDDAHTLVYTGTGHRDTGPLFTGVMTSVYVRSGSGWKLVLYQQTPTS